MQNARPEVHSYICDCLDTSNSIGEAVQARHITRENAATEAKRIFKHMAEAAKLDPDNPRLAYAICGLPGKHTLTVQDVENYISDLISKDNVRDFEPDFLKDNLPDAKVYLGNREVSLFKLIDRIDKGDILTEAELDAIDGMTVPLFGALDDLYYALEPMRKKHEAEQNDA